MDIIEFGLEDGKENLVVEKIFPSDKSESLFNLYDSSDDKIKNAVNELIDEYFSIEE